MGGHKVTEVTKAAGAKWKALGENGQKPWVTKYKAKLAEFEETMKKSNKLFVRDSPSATNSFLVVTLVGLFAGSGFTFFIFRFGFEHAQPELAYHKGLDTEHSWNVSGPIRKYF